MEVEVAVLDDDKVFGLMERDAAIRDQLLNDFGMLGFLWASEDQLSWIDRNRALLADAMVPQSRDLRHRLIIIRADVIFHFGNYLASVSAGLHFLYNYGESSFHRPLLDQVHERTTALKKTPSHRIMTMLRNRQLHGAPVIDWFNIEERNQCHIDGPGIALCPTLTDRTLVKVEKEVRKADGPTADRWDEIKEAVSSRKDWLTPLLSEHRLEVGDAFKECCSLVQKANAGELDRWERLCAELDSVLAELEAMGLESIP